MAMRCAATKNDGLPCTRTALKNIDGKGYCTIHTRIKEREKQKAIQEADVSQKEGEKLHKV